MHSSYFKFKLWREAGFFLLLGFIFASCIESPEPGDKESDTPIVSIDYSGMTVKEKHDTKKESMLLYAIDPVEEEIIDRCYSVLLEGQANGKWMDVELEDLMSHALQESKGELVKMNKKGVQDKEIWNFRSHPSNDLGGLISWSVFQAVTANYLDYGRAFHSGIETLYKDNVTKYGATVWNFKTKMKEAEGEEAASIQFSNMVDELEGILWENPDIHIQVICELVQLHYNSHGVRSPNAVREYFWLMIQKNLNPDYWLSPVRFNDDIAPSSPNGYVDNNANKRGDYGKQVVLGNSYNDRGIIFWYAATHDTDRIEKMIEVWKSDPARLKKEDYKTLKNKGYLKYTKVHSKMYDTVLAYLPNK
ncbi:hypothetical protein [Flexithrix dorotheae]|uniref:hypothetical protein n=1 Tax=Flexithrix dorotheae TaxID=70993 RepID=UPI00039E02DD|nr:hypothetical protein [Flexithrix dorotheae]